MSPLRSTHKKSEIHRLIHIKPKDIQHFNNDIANRSWLEATIQIEGEWERAQQSHAVGVKESYSTQFVSVLRQKETSDSNAAAQMYDMELAEIQ